METEGRFAGQQDKINKLIAPTVIERFSGLLTQTSQRVRRFFHLVRSDGLSDEERKRKDKIVEEMIDEGIENFSRFPLTTFEEIILGKRYL